MQGISVESFIMHDRLRFIHSDRNDTILMMS